MTILLSSCAGRGCSPGQHAVVASPAHVLLEKTRENGGQISCPPLLKRFGGSDFLPVEAGTLCELSERYQKALQRLSLRGVVNPSRIADVLAPRFINWPDWINARPRFFGKADPEPVYSPAPITWRTWDRAARLVDQRASENLRTKKLELLSLESLMAVYQTGTTYLQVQKGFRDSMNEIGRAWEHRYAPTLSQVQNMRAIEFPVFDANGNPLASADKKILEWVVTECLEEKPPEFQRAYRKDPNSRSDQEDWPTIEDSDRVFLDQKQVARQCGYIRYLPATEIAPQVQAWIEDINRGLQSGMNGPDPGQAPLADPVLLASRAQRWLVAIHPFPTGNGRTSRLIMDEIFLSLGLPAPILTEMDDDLGSSEVDWAKTVGRALLKSVEILEQCAHDLKKVGCNPVPYHE